MILFMLDMISIWLYHGIEFLRAYWLYKFLKQIVQQAKRTKISKWQRTLTDKNVAFDGLPCERSYPVRFLRKQNVGNAWHFYGCREYWKSLLRMEMPCWSLTNKLKNSNAIKMIFNDLKENLHWHLNNFTKQFQLKFGRIKVFVNSSIV